MSRARLLLVTLFGLVVWTCAFRNPPAARPPERPPTRTVAPRGPAQWQNGWTRGAVFYEAFVRSFRTPAATAREPRRPDREARLLERRRSGDDDGSGSGRALADAGLRVAELSRLRHGRLRDDQPGLRDERGLRASRLGGAPAGIRIILDFVVNHTGSGHPWFTDSASSPSSAHRDWYVWRPDDPGSTQPWGGANPTWHPLNGFYFYGVFSSGVPDLNSARPPSGARSSASPGSGSTAAPTGSGSTPPGTSWRTTRASPGGHAGDSCLLEGNRRFRASHPYRGHTGRRDWTDTPIIATYFSPRLRSPTATSCP